MWQSRDLTSASSCMQCRSRHAICGKSKEDAAPLAWHAVCLGFTLQGGTADEDYVHRTSHYEHANLRTVLGSVWNTYTEPGQPQEQWCLQSPSLYDLGTLVIANTPLSQCTGHVQML